MVYVCSGWDSFTPVAGEVSYKECRVCGSAMDIHPNCSGPRSFAAALMATDATEKFPLFDHFICPNVDENWHYQARLLLQEAEMTPSRIISDVYRTEAAEILRARKPTLKKFDNNAENA